MDRKTKGLLIALFGCVCWGLSGVFAKILFDEKELTPIWLVNVRLLCSGLILLLITLFRGPAKVTAPWRDCGGALRLLLFAVVGMLPSQACYFLAVSASNPAVATVLQYTFPVLVFFYVFYEEKRGPKLRETATLLAVSAGVFLIATHGDPGSLAITGEALFWGLLSAVGAACYNILPRGLIARYGTLPVVGWGMFLGGLCLLPFSRFREVPGIWDGETVLLIVLVILIGTVCAFACYIYGVILIGPERGSIIAGTESVVSAICTVLILGVRFHLMDVVGMILVVAAVTAMAVKNGTESA